MMARRLGAGFLVIILFSIEFCLIKNLKKKKKIISIVIIIYSYIHIYTTKAYYDDDVKTDLIIILLIYASVRFPVSFKQ